MTTASSYSDGANSRSSFDGAKQDGSTVALAELERLPVRESPLASKPYRFHGTELQPGNPRLLLFPAAVDQIVAHATSDTYSEVGGVLLGAAYRHGDQLFVEVHRALPALSSDHGPIHFTFNADAWSQIHRDREAHYPGLDIVGWFHTHPGLGIFFSGDDVIVHSAAFVLPWHLALVLDPLSKRIGGFMWERDSLSALPGLYEMLETGESRSRLPWKWRQGQVWTDSNVERMAATQPGDVEEAAPPSLFKPWYAVAVSGLALLLSLGLLLAGILPLSGQNQALRAMVASLADRTLQQSDVAAGSCPDKSLRIYVPLPDERLEQGQELTLFGTAEAPAATSYLLEVRPAGESAWWSLGTMRRAVNTSAFLTWDTSSFAPGSYQLRLSALSSAGEPLSSPAPCTVRFELTPTTSHTP
ncbi:MAG TPA: Mov34/MPN/PAD-1 family protein [Candidatus Binatia bacterium]|nr:Mov34/MPN/PAD-1 family protein [Candidatus Binatia bacterium]